MLRIEQAPLFSEAYQHCLEIRRKVFVEEQKVPLELEIEYEEESIHFLGSLLEADSAIPVCTGRLRPTPQSRVLKFERIATLKSHRGHGYGVELMKSMQNYAALHFRDREWLMGAQVSALEFYKKLGWQKKSDQSFRDAGIEHYLLHHPKG